MCGISIFWWVLACFYLVLAIVTYIRSRPISSGLFWLTQPGDSLLSYDEKQKKEVGLESTLYKAYKSTIIVDVVGFILASGAAIVSSFMT